MFYICSTPIGNLDDITLRALETLKNADFIACESIVRTRTLLAHYRIKSPLMTYREGNKRVRIGEIKRFLSEGKNIVLVSDAGTPIVSDPGFELVDELLKEGFEVSVLPGASSVVSALVLSGFSADSFTFYGFLPRTNAKRHEIYEEISLSRRTSIFFESPHRFLESISELSGYIKERRICMARELTKKFEEIVRGRCEEILEKFKDREVLGEFVIVVERGGFSSRVNEIDESLIKDMLVRKISPKTIIAELSGLGMNKKELYSMVIAVKNKISEID